MTTERRAAMVVDTRVCVGCSACALACKAENDTPEGFARSWIVKETRGTFPDLHLRILSERCMHCSDAPCVSACPTGASHYAEDGTVLVHRDLCTGCGACVTSCPYDARFMHPDGYADKCTLCYHRTSRGQEPACVEVCPTGALTYGDLNDPSSPVRELLRTRDHGVLQPEAGTRPNMFFLTPDGE